VQDREGGRQPSLSYSSSMPLAAVPDLEHELDELYGLPLEQFTKARNDLAARLRKAHQAEAAEQIKSLRKPTVAAWTANQLARSHPDLIAALVEAGDRLRNVQQRALAGKEPQAAVNEATGRERDAVRALVTAARKELGSRASPQLLDRLTQTLRAAAVEPELARTLAAGRLTEELQAVGFGTLEAVAPRRRDDSAARKAARERVKQPRAEARRLAAEAHAAERAADDAVREAERLRSEADERRRAAEQAATALADAEAAVP
jgi:hypothetical protein